MKDRELIIRITSDFKKSGIEAAGFEARQLVEFAEDREQAFTLAKRRTEGEPLQYILGEWEFYGLPFYVGEGVLIPRADTEILVETALKFIGKRALSVADLCSGSGAVAIAIAKNSNAKVAAIEKSKKALAYLEKNILRNGAAVECAEGDVFSDYEACYDLIVSNPPYIATDALKDLSKEVQREPKMALDGGADGLIFYKRLCGYWKQKIKPLGALAVEIGYDQGEQVKALFVQNGFKNIEIIKDYSGNDRVIIGTV